MHLPSPQDWVLSLLSNNELTSPDGRPLYAYRLSDNNFSELFELLKNKNNAETESMGDQDHFVTCWFFYAAEWWKRSYAGGAWSWAPIFETLGFGDLDQQVRRNWVNAASAFWKLNDEIIGGKKFLGKVVVNGGLPLKLIKEADGRLYGLLHAALNEALRSSVPLSDAQLLAQIELQSCYLPKSYRQQTVYILLVQVIRTVLDHKHFLADIGDQDPVAHLDKIRPDWLNEFPLQIDSDSARRLLVKLIRQAVTNTKKTKQSFSVVRQLRFNEDCSEWRYECSIDASSRYAVATIAQMLSMSEDSLPSAFEIVIVSENKATTIGQMFRREGDYLVKINRASLPDETFYQSLLLDVSLFGQKLGSLELEACEAPDPEVPWIFEDSNPVCRLLWAGSHKVSAASCWILNPEAASIKHEDDGTTNLGSYLDRYLVRLIRGHAVISNQNEHYEVVCGAADGLTPEGVAWGNNRLYIDSSPAYIFCGKPRLERVAVEGTRRAVPSSELFWRCNNSESSAENIRHFGVGTLFWKKQGKTLLRQRAVCLPGGNASTATINGYSGPS